MKDKRIGNDIVFEWTITRNSAAEDFSAVTSKVYLINPKGGKETLEYTIEGNVVRGCYRGKNQKKIGSYTLVLKENEGGNNMNTVDMVNCWNLVEHTEDEGGTDESSITTSAVTLTTDISYPANGVGIKSIATTTSSEDDGANVVTITLDSGKTTTFTIKNGSKGSQGDKGEKGDTPVITFSKIDNENNILVDGVVIGTILDGDKGDKGDTPKVTTTLINGTLSIYADGVLIGQITNFATLVNGKVPASQLPSFVDDVLEYDKLASFPAIGESGKIYIATDTNVTYRWSGSHYMEISASLALGETSSTAYPGDKGKANADAIGTIAALTTDVKTNLVTAINEIKAQVTNIGDLTLLTTDIKTDIVSAINELTIKVNKLLNAQQ